MVLVRLLRLRQIAQACASLLFVICLLEISLQAYNLKQTSGQVHETDAVSLIQRSWIYHHGLIPLESSLIRNPDTGTVVKLRTNSFSLRGSEPVVPKPPGLFRIVLLGDERVLAAETAESETFCARLQSLLQSHTRLRVDVVNAGVPGYCPLLSCLQFRSALLVLQPDVVILNFDMSDIADDHKYRRHTKMGAAGMPLACPHPDLPSIQPQGWMGMIDHFQLTRIAKQQLGRLALIEPEHSGRSDIDLPQGKYAWLKDDPPNWSIYIRQALSPIDHLGQTVVDSHARLIVSTYPTPWQVSPSASSADGTRRRAGVGRNVVYTNRRPFEILQRYLGERNIHFCDASLGFQRAENPDSLFLKKSSGFSSRGHELYARTLASFLFQSFSGIWDDKPGAQPPQFSGRQFSPRR